MLLPSEGIPSAMEHVVRDRPQERMGNILIGQIDNTHICILYVKTNKFAPKFKVNHAVHAGFQNPVYTLALDDSIQPGTA